MSIKSKIRQLVSFLLHGAPRPTYARISILKPNNRLEGKHIVITGGGRGLGFSIAKKCVEEGAKVLIVGRNEETLRERASILACQYLVLDISKTVSFDSFFNEASRILGKIDTLVNNAGISLHEAGFLSVSPQQFDIQFNTNLKGAFFLTQSFIKYCQQQKQQNCFKKVLFVSSETSITVDERPYGLSKAALNSLMQGLAYRYVNDDFRINAIAPGVTVSDMIGGAGTDGNLTCGYNVTGRYYLPEEVAEVSCFLLSDISNCLNGQILVCNEGKTINARWK